MTREQSAFLKRRIMRQVYGTWFRRAVFPVLLAEAALFSVIVVSMQSYVSFGHVFHNALERVGQYSFSSFGRYVAVSLYTAELVASAMMFGALLVGFFFVRDSVRLSRQFGRNFFNVPDVKI